MSGQPHGGQAAGAPQRSAQSQKQPAHAPAAQRVVVRGPQIAPSGEEALLDPREGFIRPGAGAAEELDPGIQRLITAKLRLALRIGAGFFALVILVYFTLTFTLTGGPWTWIIPGLVLYPLMIAAGWFYLRRILAYDRRYAEQRGNHRG
ncbi:hypothetical protein [Nesterenkonia alba]|uniref:hypothetical protein n=1 Tax=Nesterenkonia alba TaxID=515814 RepID=UPI0003B389AF|nr:hypothetical protein [Nesterenkonia alba]